MLVNKKFSHKKNFVTKILVKKFSVTNIFQSQEIFSQKKNLVKKNILVTKNF